jgi:predicted nucleic acid-binding protein
MRIDRYLVDTNILFRLKNTSDPDHPAATSAIFNILRSGGSLHTCPQNIVEYRVVATRPKENNGYGLSSVEATKDITDYETTFPILLDCAVNTDIYPLWRKLVEGVGTIGKPNHDARILAAAEAHGCTHVLTFNDRDFRRYSAIAPDVSIVNPNDVTAAIE